MIDILDRKNENIIQGRIPRETHQQTETPEQGVDFLLILRAFSCFLVLLHHAFGSLPQAQWGNVVRIGAFNLTFLVEGAGQAGIYIFFSLSGYLMGKGFFTRRYETTMEGARAFYINRILRIVPQYCLYVLLVLTLGGVSIPDAHAYGVSVLSLVTFRYSGNDGLVKYLSHLWSISTEVQFYLVVPILMFALMCRRPSGRVARMGIAFLLAVAFAGRLLVWKLSGEAHAVAIFMEVYKPVILTCAAETVINR